jgi:hypothetical protein
VPKTQDVLTSFVPYREKEIYEQPRTKGDFSKRISLFRRLELG